MLGRLMLNIRNSYPVPVTALCGQPRFKGRTGRLPLLVGGAAESPSKGHGSGRGENWAFFVVNLLLTSFGHRESLFRPLIFLIFLL